MRKVDFGAIAPDRGTEEKREFVQRSFEELQATPGVPAVVWQAVQHLLELAHSLGHHERIVEVSADLAAFTDRVRRL